MTIPLVQIIALILDRVRRGGQTAARAEIPVQLARIDNTIACGVEKIVEAIGKPKRRVVVTIRIGPFRPRTDILEDPPMTPVVDSAGKSPTTAQEVPLTIAFATETGGPATVDQNKPIRWDVEGDATVELVTPDGHEVIFRPPENQVAGRSVITMHADPDLGDGESDLSEAFDFTYTDEMASRVVPTFGAFRTRTDV